MFKWNKLGKVFDPTQVNDITWMKEYTQAPSTLIFDSFVRVYFSCRPKLDDCGNYVSYSAFIDLDRNNLFKIINIAKEPVLKLGGKGYFDEHGTYPISVIRQNEKVWGYYAGWTRCVSTPYNTAIGFAISNDDGESFEKLGPGPVLSYSLNEPFNIGSMSIRKYNNCFYLFYVAGKKWLLVNEKPEMSLKIRMAISKDGIIWTKQDRCIIEDKIDSDESQAGPDVIYANGKYHMFFDYWDPKTFRSTKLRKIGYAYSEDLIHWTRDDSRTGIGVSASGWDSEMVAYPHIFELDGYYFLLYLGNEIGKYGFGLARLEGKLQ
jgi:hypothetical protein